MTKTPEQLDELIHRIQNNADVSAWQYDPHDAGSVNLVSIISNIPKANIPKPNLIRVREKVLDRISLPLENSHKKNIFVSSFLQYIPRYMRITGGIVGAFMILLSMTVGTAVAALESVPGQTIYPLKKIVENVQLQLASTQEQKTNLQIKFANKRVDELETVLQRQKEGKISEADAQKIVADTVKDIQKTTQEVAEQNVLDPKVDMLNKIVSLSNKQTAVIQAAQIRSEGEVRIELDKALEVSKTTQEEAIANIENTTGLIVEKPPIVTEPVDENIVSAEGKLTNVTSLSVNIGTVQFMLTKDTKYVNINPVDLKVDVIVKITGEIIDKKTYATKIELQSKPASEIETEQTEDAPDEIIEDTPTAPTESSNTDQP